MIFNSVNPFNLELIAEYPLIDDLELDKTLLKVDQAQTQWAKTTFSERAAKWQVMADLLESKADELARLMALEMGKPMTAGVAEIKKCAALCRFYSEQTQQWMQDDCINADNKQAKIMYQPLGIIFAVMPWNYPFWQVFRCVVPSMMMGNAVVLKHAENVTGCALAIEQLMQSAGFIEHSFRTLLISIEQAKAVIRHPTVKAVSLTGSTQAGRSVAQTAGDALKKCVLELGGNDAYCVLADADLDKAAERCVTSRFQNSGQTCIAAKRWLIADEVYDDFKQRCISLAKAYVIGDPLESHTTMGPLARIDSRNTLATQLQQGLDQGAQICFQTDDTIINDHSAFFPITLLEKITAQNTMSELELFGPIASLYRMNTEAEMLTLANSSEYGLGAAVFTSDDEKAQYFAEQLQAGCIAINDFVVSHPAIPFGGIKQSGYGRELAREGLLEFVNIKSIVR